MVGFLGVVALALVGAADASPTPGDTWRLIYTDAEAFDTADRNRDGTISDHEFEVFHAARGGYDRALATQVNTPPNDVNADGAFTPNELYAEARKFDGDGRVGGNDGPVDYGDPYDED